MRRKFLIHPEIVLLLSLIASIAAHAQTIPADFKFSATAGGAAPWDTKTSITIDNLGNAHYVRYVTGANPAKFADSVFTVSIAGLQKLWKTIQDSSFTSLTSRNEPGVQDGAFTKVSVSANGTSHQIILRNVAEPRLDGILKSLNAIVPPSFKLSYAPLGVLTIVPLDPCASPSGARGGVGTTDASRLRASADPKALAWLNARSLPVSVTASVGAGRTVTGGVDVPHPGTVVAYNMLIDDAIANNIASLSSKGEFFGDDVSITVDNTVPPAPQNISMTLFLEFYGPLATQANIDNIEFDIAKKWDGVKTTGGKTIDLSFKTLADETVTSPPATPGYHQINLVPIDSLRSNVTGGKVNDGTGSGAWEIGRPPGTYAHEAGHLMGLPDRYVDCHVQADGSWLNSATNQSFKNDAAFANYILTKYSDMTLAQVLDRIKDIDTYSVPLDGSENDLMANVAKPPLQKDIDLIAANPGLLVLVPPGTILINRNGEEQNLVVTHKDDLFVKAGEKRTQNGIYAACIDHDRKGPSTAGVFDIAPPLSTWKGITAAGPLARLAQLIDSTGLYCGNVFPAQVAIWRISDNTVSSVYGSAIDEILQKAGITVGDQLLDFPHLTPGTSTSKSSKSITPNELFVASITPWVVAGKVGSPVSLTAGVSIPTVTTLAPTYTWKATGPDGSSASMAVSGVTGTLTPKGSGVYSIALSFSYKDSLYGTRTFTSARRASVIVPDNNTETFEHNGLADKFPWTAMGDIPWTISNVSAQTGAFAAQAGPVMFGQQSTLAIVVSLPADSAIKFSVRTAVQDYGKLVFSIDSSWTDQFTGLSDWQFVQYPLSAGRHLLSWTYVGSGSGLPGNIWVDNIFFPGNVAVTSVGESTPTVPLTFELEQNFPNPFNPTTVIRYGLPHRANVILSVYNALGQKVADLARGTQEAGYHEVQFDASKLASGAYFYTLTADEFVQTRKLLLVK